MVPVDLPREVGFAVTAVAVDPETGEVEVGLGMAMMDEVPEIWKRKVRMGEHSGVR
jgi:hypothetical protein